MFRKPNGKDSNHAESLASLAGFVNNNKILSAIGPNSSFNGTIVSEGGMRIDGSFEGSLTVKGPLVIGDGARIIADITADAVSVAGTVKGNINAKKVDILSTGRIYGDLITNSFTTEEGGFLRGQVRMTDGSVPEDDAAFFGQQHPLAAAS